MKTNYKYLHFEEIETNKKTSEWSCRNNRSKEELGIIKWYGMWGQYCFFPTVQTVYNESCLINVGDFLRQLTKEREGNEYKRG
jgi:hypothetical protein